MKPTVLPRRFSIERIDSLEPHPDNPNVGDHAVVARMVRRHGLYGTIAVQQSTRRIIIGHTRVRAAKALGWDAVPVAWYDVDDAAALRILLADNRTADLGVRDMAQVAALWQRVQELEGDPDATGYSAEVMARVIGSLELPTLTDLQAQYGEVDERDLWPWIRMLVPKDVHDAFYAAVDDGSGRPPHVVLGDLLARHE